MRNTIAVAAAAALLLLVHGCATIFTGTKDEVQITVEPTDARIYVDDRLVATGDTTVTIGRAGPPPTIRVEKDGYKPQKFKATKEFNYIALTNTTSVFFWATDILSGSVLKYGKNKYHVQLVREGSAGLTPGQRITRFTLANWAMLRRDLAFGGGEYLDSLGRLPAVDGAAADFRERLRANREALVAADGPMALARRVRALYEG